MKVKLVKFFYYIDEQEVYDYAILPIDAFNIHGSDSKIYYSINPGFYELEDYSIELSQAENSLLFVDSIEEILIIAKILEQ